MAQHLVTLMCGHKVTHEIPDPGEFEAERCSKLEETYCPNCGEVGRDIKSTILLSPMSESTVINGRWWVTRGGHTVCLDSEGMIVAANCGDDWKQLTWIASPHPFKWLAA